MLPAGGLLLLPAVLIGVLFLQQLRDYFVILFPLAILNPQLRFGLTGVVIAETKEGKEQILHILSEGDFIGYLNLLKKGKFDFNAEALEDVSVCLLTKDDFDKILKKAPEISLRILENLHDRLVSLESLVQTLSTKDIEARIATLLRGFAKDFGREENKSIVIDLPLSREEMANYIGVTRETMSRKLTAMEEDKVIELVGNKKVVIKNMEALENLL
jgi:CRP/FNR family transcriptional regulator